MKKWSFLVATLLLMGATATTFTSCVDTDEPEGILEMRKAKAEYIRALAAVENAKIAYQQAAAQTEQANADLLKAQAEVQKAQAEVAKAQAQSAIIQAEAAAKAAEIVAEGQKSLDEAKAEIAKAEAAKILVEAAQAQAELDQTIAENEIKLQEYKAGLEVELQKSQTELVKAQMQYELALKDLAALDLVASADEAKILYTARENYKNAYSALNTQIAAVNTAQSKLLSTMYTQENALETLKNKVAEKNADLAAKQAAYEELKKLGEDTSADAWDADVKEMEAYVGTAFSTWPAAPATAAITSGKQAGKAIEEWRDLEYKKKSVLADNPKVKEDLDATLKAYIIAQGNYNFLANADKKDCTVAGDKCEGTLPAGWTKWGVKTKEGTHTSPEEFRTAVKSDYSFKAGEIKVENKTVETKLGSLVSGGKLSYAAQNGLKYTDFDMPWKTSTEDTKGDKNTLNAASAISSWETKLNEIKVTADEMEKKGCTDDYETAVTTATNNLNAAIDRWSKLHEQYKGGDGSAIKLPVATTNIDAAIAKYNAQFDELAQAVKDYNEKYKTTVKNESEKALKAAKAAVGLGAAVGYLNTSWASEFGGSLAPSDFADQNELLDLVKGHKTTLGTNYNTVITTVQSNLDTAWKSIWTTEDADIQQGLADAAGVTAANTEKATAGKPLYVAYGKITSAETAIKTASTSFTDWTTGDDNSLLGKNTKGSQGLLENALKVYEGDLNNAGQVLDKNSGAAKYPTSVAELTGVGTKYLKNGDSKTIADNDKSKSTYNGAYVVEEVELKTGAATYTPTGCYTIVRSKIGDFAAYTKSKVTLAQSETQWIKASKEAFGTDGTKDNTRHAVLDAATYDNSTSTWLDDNGKTLTNYATSKLKALVDAQKNLEDAKALAAASEYIDTLKKAVAAQKASFEAEIAAYKAEIDKAEQAIEPAKTAHVKAHEAYVALTESINKAQAEIEAKFKGIAPVYNAAKKVIEAYYTNQSIKYASFPGDTEADAEGNVVIDWIVAGNKDFSGVQKWVNAQIKKYTTTAPAGTVPAELTGAGLSDHGYIANAKAVAEIYQKKLAEAEKTGVNADENINQFLIDTDKADLAYKEAILKLYQEQFARAEEALNKVLEAIGNGVYDITNGTAIVKPSANGNVPASSTTGTSNPSSDTITIDL